MQVFNTEFQSQEQLQDFIKSSFDNECPNILVQIFSASTDSDLVLTIAKNIKSTLPQANILGTTTAGEIYAGVMSEHKIVISFALFNTTKICSKLIPITSQEDIASQMEELIFDDTKLFIIFSDGLRSNGEMIIEDITNFYPHIAIAGGRAGDDNQFQKTFVFNEQRATESGFVIASLSSKELTIHNDYILNWQSIGQEMIVTRSQNNTLYELNHTNIIDIYNKYLGPDVVDRLPFSGIEFPLIFKKDGVEIARAPVAITDDNALIFGGNIDEGTKVQFGFGDLQTIRNSAYNNYQKLEDLPIEAIFIYSCSARKAFMQKELEVEFGLLQNIAPCVGFLTYGEYFHQNNSNKLLNITTTVLTLSESKTPYKVHKQPTPKKEELTNTTLKALTTLLKVTSKELTDNNKILNHSQALATLGSWQWDITQDKVWWSDEIYNIFGVNKGDFDGSLESFINYLHEDDQAYFTKTIQDTVDDSTHTFRIEHKLLTKDGELKYALGTGEAILDESNKPTKVVGVLQDITRQKLQEIALQIKTEEQHDLLSLFDVGNLSGMTIVRGASNMSPTVSKPLWATPKMIFSASKSLI